MNQWLRLGGWGAIGIALLWIVFEVVTAVLGFLSWVVSTIITIVVAAVVLYLAYLVLSRLVRGGGAETETAQI
jgi:putative flippase GtrA